MVKADRSNHVLRQAAKAHRQGDLRLAESLYRQVLKLRPGDADALHLLGGIALQEGDCVQAQQQIEAALKVRPKDALFLANLASVFIAQQRFQQAETHAEQAVAAQQDVFEAWLVLGTAQAYLGKHVSAEAAFLKALALKPQHAETHNNLANVLKAMARWQAAESHYCRAIELAPQSPDAYSNLGSLYLAQARYEDAQKVLLQAVSLAATLPTAWNNLAQACQAQGKLAEADAAYGRALALEPDQLLWRYRRTMLCPVIAESTKRTGYWRKRFGKQLDALPDLNITDHLNQLATSHAEPPYHLTYQGCDNFELRQRFASKCVGIPQPPLDKKRGHGKPRIGILVTAGHEGIFDACSRGLFKAWQHDHAQLVLCAPAAFGQRWQARMPELEWVPLQQQLGACAEAIWAAQLDLLYFWEVGSDALNYFLARLRMAAVQVTSWGTPESTALPEIDAYLTCEGWREGCQDESFSEQLVVLPQIPMVYRAPPVAASTTEAALLPASVQGHVYACVQNLFKLHPDMDDLLAGILQQDEKAIIYLVEGKQKHWTELLQKRLQLRLKADAERVKFLPRMAYSAYLDLIQRVDCLLDSPHFSGGNTSFEALSLSRPIVTLPGTFGRSRFTTACYRQLGYAEMVAVDGADYVAKAVRLASDVAWRNQVRQALADRRHRLIDQTTAGVAFQEALIQLCCS